MPFANRYMFSGRRNLVDEVARLRVGRQRNRRFDLGVFWKAFRIRQVKRAPALVKTEISVPGAVNELGHAVGVANKKVRSIYQQPVAIGGFDLETPDHRTRE